MQLQPPRSQPSQAAQPGSPLFPNWGAKKPRSDLFKQEHYDDALDEPAEEGAAADGRDPPADAVALPIAAQPKQEVPSQEVPPIDAGLTVDVSGFRLQVTVPPGLASSPRDLLPNTPLPTASTTSLPLAAHASTTASTGVQTLITPAATPPESEEVPAAGQGAPAQQRPATATAAAVAVGEAGSGQVHLPPGLHHLTRHWLPEGLRGEAVLRQLGATDYKSADHLIKNMGQRELRLAFQRVYNCETQSYNNNWLRRKLMEAAGLKATPSPRHSRGGGSSGGHAARPRTARAAPRRPPSTAASLPQGAPVPTGGDVAKKVTRKAATAAAEADAVAALQTMMAGGAGGDGGWEGEGEGGSDCELGSAVGAEGEESDFEQGCRLQQKEKEGGEEELRPAPPADIWQGIAAADAGEAGRCGASQEGPAGRGSGGIEGHASREAAEWRSADARSGHPAPATGADTQQQQQQG